MIGDEIFATLTPMTFRKVGFQWRCDELCGEAFALSLVCFSRPSLPIIEIDPEYSDRLAGQTLPV